MVRMNRLLTPQMQARLVTLACLCLAMFASLVNAQSLEVIQLQYRTAEEVMPVLQPLLAPGDALTGSDYKLFVRASAGTVKQLRSALEQLDRKPRQLVVSVRRASKGIIERESASANVQLGTQGARGSVIATQDSGARDGGDVASVQVIEGNAAFISTGQSIPIVTGVAAGGRNRWAASSTSYRDLNSGFTVTPRIAGSNVTLDIEQQNETVGNASNVHTQSLSTQVRGSLNEWISLGAVNESTTTQQSGILSRQYATQSDATTLWVKVEEL